MTNLEISQQPSAPPPPAPFPLLVKTSTKFLQVWIENISGHTVELKRPGEASVILKPGCALDITFHTEKKKRRR